MILCKMILYKMIALQAFSCSGSQLVGHNVLNHFKTMLTAIAGVNSFRRLALWFKPSASHTLTY